MLLILLAKVKYDRHLLHKVLVGNKKKHLLHEKEERWHFDGLEVPDWNVSNAELDEWPATFPKDNNRVYIVSELNYPIYLNKNEQDYPDEVSKPVFDDTFLPDACR